LFHCSFIFNALLIYKGAERPIDDPVFDLMDTILGCRPVNNTSGVADSLEDQVEIEVEGSFFYLTCFYS
jgi:hypothetical protein